MKRIALHAICPICEGHGRISYHLGKSRTRLCSRCSGKGFVVTEEGRTVIALVKAAGIDGLLPDAGV